MPCLTTIVDNKSEYVVVVDDDVVEKALTQRVSQSCGREGSRLKR